MSKGLGYYSILCLLGHAQCLVYKVYMKFVCQTEIVTASRRVTILILFNIKQHIHPLFSLSLFVSVGDTKLSITDWNAYWMCSVASCRDSLITNARLAFVMGRLDVLLVNVMSNCLPCPRIIAS